MTYLEEGEEAPVSVDGSEALSGSVHSELEVLSAPLAALAPLAIMSLCCALTLAKRWVSRVTAWKCEIVFTGDLGDDAGDLSLEESSFSMTT